MKAWLRDLGQLLACAALVLGILLGCSAYERGHSSPLRAERPTVYIISVSRVAYPDADVWLVAYAIDGHAEAVEIPETQDPDEFLAYLGKVGDVERRP